jgi:hypothetical protein
MEVVERILMSLELPRRDFRRAIRKKTSMSLKTRLKFRPHVISHIRIDSRG